MAALRCRVPTLLSFRTRTVREGGKARRTVGGRLRGGGRGRGSRPVVWCCSAGFFWFGRLLAPYGMALVSVIDRANGSIPQESIQVVDGDLQ